MWKCHCEYTTGNTEQHLVPKTFRFKSLLQPNLEYGVELVFSTEGRSVLVAKLLFLLERQDVLRYTKIYSLVFQTERVGGPGEVRCLAQAQIIFPCSQISHGFCRSLRHPLCNPRQEESEDSAMSGWNYAPAWQDKNDRGLRSVAICSQAWLRTSQRQAQFKKRTLNGCVEQGILPGSDFVCAWCPTARTLLRCMQTC